MKASRPKEVFLSSSLRALSCLSCCSQRPCSLWTYVTKNEMELCKKKKKRTEQRRLQVVLQLTSSLCSSFSFSSACLSLSFSWASSFSLCRLSCCSCCSLRGATRRGDPGGADPRTATAGLCTDWTVRREKSKPRKLNQVQNESARAFFFFRKNTVQIFNYYVQYDICHMSIISHVLNLRSNQDTSIYDNGIGEY